MFKLTLSKPVIRLLYKFVDVEFSGNMAVPDDRMIEYSYALSRVVKNVKTKSIVLDVGCVARINTVPETLCELGYNVTGIDTRVFHYKHPNFRFVQASILDYKVFNLYDCVTLVSTLEHIGIKGRYGIDRTNYYADYLAVQNIRKLLKLGGIVVMTVPFSQYDSTIGVHRIYDEVSIGRLFSDGFEIVEKKYYERDANDVLIGREQSSKKTHLICLVAKKVS